MSDTTTVGGAREVADGIFEADAPFWGFPLSLYFIRSGERWAVVDTGIATTPEEVIVPFLADRGGLGSLELVLGTHGHVDHIGGNGALKALAPHVTFSIHELDLAWTEDYDRHIGQLYEYGEPAGYQLDAETDAALRGAMGDPVAVERIFSGTHDLVSFGEGRELEVTRVGGHSPGHVVFRDRQTGVVFNGDTLQGSGAWNVETEKRDFPMYRTVRDYRAALETVRGLDASVLCTAHAGPLRGAEIGAGIDASLAWSEEFSRLVAALAARLGSFTLAEMVDAVLEERPEHARLLQINVTTAEHLDDLVRGGGLTPSIDGGAKRWTHRGADAAASEHT
jgi:glyoxylase-like metal-dependent hydrolase (beta-lactamase superfamily II)